MSPDLSFVFQTYGQSFRSVFFLVGVLVVIVLVVTGVKQSQLLDLSLGLEFDKRHLTPILSYVESQN